MGIYFTHNKTKIELTKHALNRFQERFNDGGYNSDAPKNLYNKVCKAMEHGKVEETDKEHVFRFSFGKFVYVVEVNDDKSTLVTMMKLSNKRETGSFTFMSRNPSTLIRDM